MQLLGSIANVYDTLLSSIANVYDTFSKDKTQDTYLSLNDETQVIFQMNAKI